MPVFFGDFAFCRFNIFGVLASAMFDSGKLFTGALQFTRDVRHFG